MITTIATVELAEKIEFIYRELSNLCRKINKDISTLNYELKNDTQEFAVISYSDKKAVKVDITGLNKKSLTHRILMEI